MIADDEDLGVARDREVRLGRNASGAIDGDAEQSRQRRRGHTGGPQYCLRGNALAADRHPLLVDRRHRGTGTDLDAEPLERLTSRVPQRLGKGA